MRVIPALVMVAAALTGCAGMQPVPESEKTVIKVIETPGQSKDKIYNATRVWFSESFKSSKAVIDLEDKEQGIIIGKGNTKFPCQGFDCMSKADWRLKFTMRVDMKDEKMRITFNDIGVAWPSSYSGGIASPSYDGPINTIGDMQKAKPELERIADSLAASIANPAKSDW